MYSAKSSGYFTMGTFRPDVQVCSGSRLWLSNPGKQYGEIDKIDSCESPDMPGLHDLVPGSSTG
jgi:hypothetical protein